MTNKSNKSGNLRGSQPRTKQPKQQQQPRANASRVGTGNDAVRYAPVSVATRRTGMAPIVRTRGDVTSITHRSFLSPISNEAAYTVNRYPCNPGLSETFPWLHRVARRYEEYRFKRLKFEYRSVTSTSTMGVIMMSFDYDAADSLPTSKQSQAQTVPNAESNAWTNIDLVVPCAASNWLYVRPGTLAANLDIKTYDYGQMFISSLYGNGVISGELYVEYEVELRRPTDGPIGGCTLGFVPTSLTTPFSGANALATAGISPIRVINPTTIEFVTSGEFLLIFTYFGTGITGNINVPSFTGLGASKVLTALPAFWSSAQSTRSLVVRAAIGDRIVIASLVSGTITSFACVVSLADYDALL